MAFQKRYQELEATQSQLGIGNRELDWKFQELMKSVTFGHRSAGPRAATAASPSDSSPQLFFGCFSPLFWPIRSFCTFLRLSSLARSQRATRRKECKMAAKVRLLLVGCSQSPTVTTNDLAGAGAGPARKRPRRRVRRLFTRDLWDLWLSSRFPAVSWLASSAKTGYMYSERKNIDCLPRKWARTAGKR